MTSPSRGDIQFGATAFGNLTVTKPTDTGSGDLLIAHLSSRSTGIAAGITLPSGWDRLASTSDGRASIAYKVAGGSEPSSYTFTLASSFVHASISRISNVNTSSPIATHYAGTPGSGLYTSMSAPANSLAILFANWEFDGAPLADPGGSWTVAYERSADDGDGVANRVQMATQTFTAASETGTPTSPGGGGNIVTMGVVVAGLSAPPEINSSLTASGTQGTSFSYTITATNTPASYSASGLPTGLSVNTSTGAITGTPTVSGAYNVTIGATNASGSDSETLVITLASAVPVISSNFYASGTQDQSFSYSITASNTPTSYSATGLPTGLSVNSSTGAITGTPTVYGLFSATMTAANSWGSDTESLVITIAPPTAGALAAERWRLRGDAIPVAQVTEMTIPEGQGSIEIEINGKTATFTSPTAASIATAWAAGSTGTPETAALSEPEFAEITPTNSGTTLILTAATPGKPFRIGRISLGGANPSNAVQRYAITNSPTGGTYTITLLGQTTSGIAITATAAEVQTALEALPSVVPGDVLVVQPTAGVPTYELRFGGILAGTAIAAITVDRSGLTGGTSALAVTVTQDGIAPVNEVQTITLPGNTTGGTFTLTYAGQTTSGIAYNASNATIQTALQGLSTIGSGNVTVAGGTIPESPITVTFTGALAGTNVATITADGSSLTTGSAPVVVATEEAGQTSGGEASVKFRFGSALAAGTLVKFRYSGPVDTDYVAAPPQYSAAVAWDAGNTALKAAFEAMTVGYSTSYVDGEFAPASGYVSRTVGSGNTTFTGTLGTASDLTIAFSGADWKYRVTPSAAQLAIVLASDNSIVDLAATSATVGALNEIQSVTNSGNVAGLFKLRCTLKGGGTVDTAPIDNRATGQQVIDAINAALGETAVSRAQTGNTFGPLGTYPVYVRFANYGYQCINVTQMTVLGDNVSVVTTTEGDPGQSELQTVSLTNSPWGGSIKLVRGTATSALDWDSTAAEVESAIEALAGVGSGNVVATGGPWPAPISLAFAPSLGNIATITSQDNALRNAVITVTEPVGGGVAITPRNTQRSLGPAHWNDPLTWQNDAGANGVPGYGDTVICDTGRQDLTYGLRQRVTCTAEAAADELILSEADVFAVGQRVRLSTTGTLPSGLSTGTDYYVVYAEDRRVRLSTSRGGAVVAIGGSGSGTHTIEVVLAVLRLRSTWTGRLGLPAVTSLTDGVRELLPQYLELGASEIEIGAGEGSGQQRIKLNVGPHQTTCTVVSTAGSADPGLKAMMFLGSNTNNVLEVVRGDVAVAYYAQETAALARLTQRGGSVYLGRGVALGTLDKTGGTIFADGAVLDGAVNIRG